jgi:uncharacterized protein
MAKNRVRKWLRILHRDFGYLAAGLTIVYAISGIAVNHVQDWNPNITIERTMHTIGDAQGVSAEEVLTRLGESTEHKSTFRPNPNTLQIFAENTTYTLDISSGKVEKEVTATRPLIYESNFLHLNHPKKWWTWVADAFAVVLVFLAISGLFMIKGKKGLSGRGKWFAGAGVAIPLLFLWLYL